MVTVSIPIVTVDSCCGGLDFVLVPVGKGLLLQCHVPESTKLATIHPKQHDLACERDQRQRLVAAMLLLVTASIRYESSLAARTKLFFKRGYSRSPTKRL